MEPVGRPFPVSSTVSHYSEEKTKVKDFSLSVRLGAGTALEPSFTRKKKKDTVFRVLLFSKIHLARR
jgi:hypothetical protein